MSRQKKKKPLDRVKVKSFIQEHYGTYGDFCKASKIILSSFKSYMLGIDTMPAIDKAVREAMQEKEYPIAFAENPTIESNIQKSFIEANNTGESKSVIAPGVKLHIEASTA